MSQTTRGIGDYIQFLVNGNDRVLVVGGRANCWLLSTGRIAKMETEGSSWVWVHEGACGRMGDPLSRFNVWEPRISFYSFGDWGYHTNNHDSQIMTGFSPTPPGVEICGNYKIIYVAALRWDTSHQRANIFLRRKPNLGGVVIKECPQPFTISVDGRIGNTGEASRSVIDQTILDGEVSLPNNGHDIDRYFGPGFKFYGFEADSEATSSYESMAANASLIVTKKNDNKGRIYLVDKPKAFKLVHSETGIVAEESASFDSQEHETNEARRICKCRHYSFLCRELNLPCSTSALITAFVVECQPFIFAESGDIWIDIRLSTPNRTYVLARRDSGPVVLSEEMLEQRATNMRVEFLQNLNECELLKSANELLSTPNAGETILDIALEDVFRFNDTDLNNIIEMINALYKNGKVSKEDIESAIIGLRHSFFHWSLKGSTKIFVAFCHINALSAICLSECIRFMFFGESNVEITEVIAKALRKSHSDGRVQSFFWGPSVRNTLERLLGLNTFQDIVTEVLSSGEKHELYAKKMTIEFIQNRDECELLASMEKLLLVTPDASKITVQVNLDYATGCTASELSAIIDIVTILYMSGKLMQADIASVMADLVEFVDSVSYDNPNIFGYVGEMFCAFCDANALTVDWLCDCISRVEDELCRPKVIKGVLKAANEYHDVVPRFVSLSGRAALEHLLGTPRSCRYLWVPTGYGFYSRIAHDPTDAYGIPVSRHLDRSAL